MNCNLIVSIKADIVILVLKPLWSSFQDQLTLISILCQMKF